MFWRPTQNRNKEGRTGFCLLSKTKVAPRGSRIGLSRFSSGSFHSGSLSFRKRVGGDIPGQTVQIKDKVTAKGGILSIPEKCFHTGKGPRTCPVRTTLFCDVRSVDNFFLSLYPSKRI